VSALYARLTFVARAPSHFFRELAGLLQKPIELLPRAAQPIHLNAVVVFAFPNAEGKSPMLHDGALLRSLRREELELTRLSRAAQMCLSNCRLHS